MVRFGGCGCEVVTATGEQQSVGEFVEATARELEIKLTWKGKGAEEKGYDGAGRCIVAIDRHYFRPAEVDTLVGDNTKARNKLGWQPRVRLREGIARTLEFYREHRGKYW